jgi:putative thioredoxin
LLTHGAPDDLPESPARDALRQGIAELQAGNVEGAMAALLESVRVQRDYQDDMARKTLLALFTLLGDRDELTRQYRRALERALF